MGKLEKQMSSIYVVLWTLSIMEIPVWIEKRRISIGERELNPLYTYGNFI